jgi:hypothetical protein
MALRSAREKRYQTIGQKLESVIMLVLAGNRAIVRGASRPATETHGFNTSLARSTPWHFAGSGGQDVAHARVKVSRAAWPWNLEKGDVSFMAVARPDLAPRRGVRG